MYLLCCIRTLYIYKLLCCESPCTQANWEKEALTLFASLETGYAGCHVHVDTKTTFSCGAWIIRPPCKLPLFKNFAGTDTFCKIFHHICTLQYCVSSLCLRILQELTLSARFSITSVPCNTVFLPFVLEFCRN